MLCLKQSTSVVVSFGPALLFSDGVTLVVNLAGTGANQTESTTTGIRISKNGAAFIARSATATASTYDAFGNYLVTLSTTDTNTLGTLRMQFANSAAFCPIWMDFMVLPANMWNSLFGTGGSIPDAVAGAAGGVFIAGTNAATAITTGLTAHLIGTVDTLTTYTGNTPQTGDVYPKVDTEIADIQARLPAALTAGGNMKADALAINAVATTPVTTIKAVQGLAVDGVVPTVTNLTNAPTAGDLTATMKTSVKTQVTDGLNVDTYAEPGQEAPPATTTLVKKIGWLYKTFRNRKTQTATTLSIYADDATTVDAKATVSDNGVTLDSGEIGTGP